MIDIRLDDEYKGNIYRLYGDGWYCVFSKSNRYTWLKPCMEMQAKLTNRAILQGFCVNPKPKAVQEEKEKKKRVAKQKSTKTVSKTVSKSFVSLF